MFHVVLYEPEIPPNTGNIIRLCANTGARLHLIKPLGFRLDDKSLQRSGLDYHDLTDVSVHASFTDCVAALGNCRIFAIETGAGPGYADAAFQSGDAFLFGPETRGLPFTVLDQVPLAHQLVIPMRPGNRSLNLSNCAAIVVYEAWRQLKFAL